MLGANVVAFRLKFRNKIVSRLCGSKDSWAGTECGKMIWFLQSTHGSDWHRPYEACFDNMSLNSVLLLPVARLPGVQVSIHICCVIRLLWGCESISEKCCANVYACDLNWKKKYRKEEPTVLSLLKCSRTLFVLYLELCCKVEIPSYQRDATGVIFVCLFLVLLLLKFNKINITWTDLQYDSNILKQNLTSEYHVSFVFISLKM